MKSLFGASSNFYRGTSFGLAVEGAPAMVREFKVHATTTRSYVVDHGMKVSKKDMQLHFSNFAVDMFATAEEATQSLASAGMQPRKSSNTTGTNP